MLSSWMLHFHDSSALPRGLKMLSGEKRVNLEKLHDIFVTDLLLYLFVFSSVCVLIENTSYVQDSFSL